VENVTDRPVGRVGHVPDFHGGLGIRKFPSKMEERRIPHKKIGIGA
jgi:hypothetical protein